MQQHAEPSDGRMSAKPRLAQQFRLERHIDDVRHERSRLQSRESKTVARLSDHAERGRVGEEIDVRQNLRQAIERDGLRRPRQAGDESVGALRRPVRDDHALDTAQHKSHDDRARRASGAEHEPGARRHSPARHLLVEIGDETVHIGVVAVQPAVFVEPDRIHRGELPGELRRRVDEAECRLLMGQGDVAAAIAALAKSGDEACQRVARHPFASVAPLDAKLGKPEAVHQGRSRMRNRIADDAGMLHEDGLLRTPIPPRLRLFRDQ